MRFSKNNQGRRRATAREGFTLAEALIASTILAMVSATALLPFAAGLQQAEEAAIQEQAVVLGEAMMEEVLARPFFEPDERVAAPGPGVGETSRDLYNNIDDFDNFTEKYSGITDFDGAVITDPLLAGYWRDVSVDYITYPGQPNTDVGSFVHIKVNVYYGNRKVLTLDRIATRED